MPANPLEARVLEVEHSPFTKKPEIETSRPTQTGRFLVCVAADARRCCDSTRTRSFPRWREVLTCVAVPLRRKCRSRLLTSKTTATVTWLDRKGNPRGGAHGSAASRVLRGRAAKPPGEEGGRRSSRQTSLLDSGWTSRTLSTDALRPRSQTRQSSRVSSPQSTGGRTCLLKAGLVIL